MNNLLSFNTKTLRPGIFLTYLWGLNHEQFADAVSKLPGDNVYTAILKPEYNLKDQALSIEQKRDALKFLIHLVGDAHGSAETLTII